MTVRSSRAVLRQAMTGAAVVALAAGCGGGGGGGSFPTTPGLPGIPTLPISTPALPGVPGLPGSPGLPSGPSLPGSPSPPTDSELTAEFDANYALARLNADAAYAANVTGEGSLVAVIDTGIDIDHADLVDNISASSIDIVTNSIATLDDPAGHGTNVAGVIAAQRNGVGMHGVAYDAAIMAIRTDSIGSCATSCSFDDTDLAAAVTYAVTNGADVINLSLGGNSSLPNFNQAIVNAVNAGVFVVISAGNDGAANPALSALIAWDPAIRGEMIIAGSVDSSNVISTFSARAGSYGSVYLVAPGEAIYTTDIGGGYTNVGGTSFSAPHIAGAAALLKQYFPTLTGGEIAEILLASAVDLGAAGVDTVYGSGLVDIEAALEPIGSLSVPSGGGSLSGSGLSPGPAFGDAFANLHAVETVALDAYDRAYRTEIGARVLASEPTFSLAASLDRRRAEVRRAERTKGGLSVAAFSSDPNALAVDGEALSEIHASRPSEVSYGTALVQQTDRRTHVGLAFNAELDQMLTPDAGADGVHGAFLSSAFADTRRADASDTDLHAGLAHDLGGGWSARMILSHGESAAPARAAAFGDEEAARHAEAAARLIHRSAAGGLALGIDLATEDGSVLDSRSTGALALGEGTRSVTAHLEGDVRLDRWVLFGEAALGAVDVIGDGRGILGDMGTLLTSAVRLGGYRADILAADDVLGFGIAQPLRVESGSAHVTTATDYDYDTETAALARSRLDLAPSGRAIDLEAFYRLRLWDSAALELNVLHQMEPGHNADAAAATHALVRLKTTF